MRNNTNRKNKIVSVICVVMLTITLFVGLCEFVERNSYTVTTVTVGEPVFYTLNENGEKVPLDLD